MKLTEDQIEELFRFAKRHYVEHYDVQVEIVDHLASVIEEQFRENPNQEFKSILNEAYAGFGAMGLSGFIDSMQQKVSTQSRKMLFEEFFRFFKPPQLLLSALVLFGLIILFQRLSLLQIRYTMIGVVLAGSVSVFTQFFILRKSFKQPLLHWQQPYVMAASGLLLSVFNLLFQEKTIAIIPNYPLITAAITGTCLLLFYSC
jgi:hypothetical protein